MRDPLGPLIPLNGAKVRIFLQIAKLSCRFFWRKQFFVVFGRLQKAYGLLSLLVVSQPSLYGASLEVVGGNDVEFQHLSQDGFMLVQIGGDVVLQFAL